ncbi:alpha/beta fold hydrolase [Mobilitalea sibirica]|uniref:Alpha/beta fold hydrolase n=1 Tax=Mobilitalea sibirica TaxID=1462919 RepID=A0A8J7KZ41_9FIRM|nr:alpha/beta fold hydrolase [Mobilitalea sibirica]
MKRIIKSIAATIIICLILLIIAPFVALPLFLNRHVDYKGYTTQNYPLQDIYVATDYALNENQIYLKTEDGLNLWTSEIFAENPKAVIIYLSGIVQPSVTYFYGHAKYMQDNGYASILLEVRGHGKSDGNRICLGYEETKDVQAVVDYIQSSPKYDGVPIVLHGVSMGGAIAVNAFGQIDEIDALIAMSAYSSFEDVVIDIMDNYGIPQFIQTFEKPLISSSLKMMFGSEAVEHIKPIEQIKNTNGRPVLLMASSGDMEVPMDNLHRLKDANPNVEVWIRDSWEHFIVKDCDFKNMAKDKEYCNKLLEFIEKSLGY